MTQSAEERYHFWKRISWLAATILQLVWLSIILLSDLALFFPEQPLAYLITVHLSLSLVALPLDLASGFFLERSFGLSHQSLVTWAIDEIKKTALSLCFFLLTSFFFLWTVVHFPEHWWIALGLAWFCFSVALTTLFPVLFIPLFFPCKPLGDTPLKRDLLDWCRKLGLDVPEIYEIALSRKTTKANASVTGFGGTRRVLLADTLLASFTPEEIRMVLSHEIGHHKLGHLRRSVLFEFILSLAGFWLLFRSSALVVSMANAGSLEEATVIPAVMLLAALASLLAMPLRNAFSRMQERDADRYAWNVYPDGEVFESLMNKLAAQNLSKRSVPRWEEWLWSSHPSTERRIALARHFFQSRSC